MNSRYTKFLFIAFLTVCIISIGTFKSDSTGATPQIVVSPPQLSPSFFSPVPSIFRPLILENVTSSIPVANVTLYYSDLSMHGFPQNAPLNVSGYANSTVMTFQNANGNSYLYSVLMPREPNYTYVLAEGKVVLQNGSTLFSTGTEIYWVMDPLPITLLSLNLEISDVNSTDLVLTLNSYNTFYNTIEYHGANLYVTGSYSSSISVGEASSSSDFQSPAFNFDSYYTSGDPRLFPFDGYNYTFDISTILYPSLTNVTLNGANLLPNVTRSGEIIKTTPGSFRQYVDDSQWKFQTLATYVPATNSSRDAQIEITIMMTRNQRNVNEAMIPVVAVFFLLGISTLLTGEQRTQNRIFVYVSIFVFSFGFFSGIRTLYSPPFTVGLSLVERLTFALIPSTVFLAAFSMIGAKTKKLQTLLDFVATVLAVGITIYLAAFRTPGYIVSGGSETWSLFALGIWGVMIVVGLFSGLALTLARIGWHRWRQRYVLESY